LALSLQNLGEFFLLRSNFVSETPLPSVGSSDTETVENTIQRKWDKFAMPDLSVDPESQRPPLVRASSRPTSSANASRAFDSLPAFDSTTALGDAFARAETIEELSDDGHR
jgi:hypothetical protein